MTPVSHVPRVALPSVTFFWGGPQLLRTEVANILSDVCDAQAHSFASPIRDGVLGTFFMGDPTIDVSKLTALPILPNSSLTFGDFISAYSQFLPSLFGDPAIIGRLARRRVEENLDYFHHFIFDDADTKENVRIVADVFGRSNALIVNFGPHTGVASKSMRIIHLPDGLNEPLSIIHHLATQLNPLPVPPLIPTASPSTVPQRTILDDLL